MNQNQWIAPVDGLRIKSEKRVDVPGSNLWLQLAALVHEGNYFLIFVLIFITYTRIS
ncbi:MAG: hypothetical protein ROO73_00340 [Roseivirga sp.]